VAAFDDMVIQTLIQREAGSEGSRLAGRDPAELLAELEPRRGPERVLDFMLRAGPYGDGFGLDPDGLTLDVLEQNPHGVDLGPLEPRVPDVLRTESGKIELAPEPIVADLDRLRAAMARERDAIAAHRAPPGARARRGLVLIGRRQLRSNNSWMHNLPALVKGKERCTLHIHPDDAERLGLADGAAALLRSAAGSLEAPVEVTEDIMPGVVSIPHGWGHDAAGVRMSVASAHAGVNSNLLADESLVEPLSGNAVLNGIPVEVSASDGLEHRPAAVAADHVGGV
jgi:anaerobic selenocysteine-containing dehydrogenase